MIAAGRLMFILGMIEMDISFIKAFKLTMVGNFFNIVIPGAVGGDVIKGAYLFRTEEKPRGRSAGIIMIDRLMGFFALLFIGASALAYLSLMESYILTRYMREFKLIIIITIISSIIFLILILLGKKSGFRQVMNKIATKTLRDSVTYRMVEAMGSLTRRRRVLVYTFVMSITVQLFALAGLLILINVVNDKTHNFILLGAISSIILILGIVPVTPGNVGWTELLASIGWSTFGSASGAAVFLFWRLVTVIFSLPGMLFYFTAKKDFPSEDVRLINVQIKRIEM
jgi:glycosyltransferase 2 family protein